MIFNIQHFHKVCKAFLGNMDMLETFLSNHAIKKHFISLMTTHRGHLFEIADLKKEDKKRNAIFLLIFDKDSLIAISRVQKIKQIPEINMVHVNALYRGQKWCQKMISTLIRKTSHIYTTFELYTDKTNVAAIACYEKCGFKIIKTTKPNDVIMRYSL